MRLNRDGQVIATSPEVGTVDSVYQGAIDGGMPPSKI